MPVQARTKEIDASGAPLQALPAQFSGERSSGAGGPFKYAFDKAIDYLSGYVVSHPRDWAGYASRARLGEPGRSTPERSLTMTSPSGLSR